MMTSRFGESGRRHCFCTLLYRERHLLQEIDVNQNKVAVRCLQEFSVVTEIKVVATFLGK